ncbi:UDP-N-acetylmuramate dehydrogenase [Amycolatopsis albispora]|uniref:UDP-N-acetylenolpyruvoylglucosamine reductase n=1 Tax=Amycolatopsis albispora TaxID=1804986 RepID=A0A344LEZ9_9PSEU|nr:UDP-N-acetylmuramate dehydrogenase [Amycolatopsis albispora]AXB46623.1 UDP-N-acetylenolpyruvoylglucosamine reductase [Amycolatopsis albispora]
MSTLQTPTQAALSEHTTLRLGGPARRFAEATTSDELVAAVRAADAAGEPLLLLGGGSNLVVADEGFDGTVLKIATTGRTFQPDGPVVRVTAEAGENWDEFVAWTVRSGLGGLECLSGIPGLVGATPIQNVGAYGFEIADLLRSVRLYDRRTGEVRTLAKEQLRLGYRTSVLKGTDHGVVLSVELDLHGDGLSSPIRYAELAKKLDVEIGARVPTASVREAVLELRRGKGMVLDPADHDTWSAGSFFTNPILPESRVTAVLARIAEVVGDDVPVPQYPADNGVKLSAAWLIERAGFGKGHTGAGGRVSLSTKHTLALTNRGSATTAELLSLAREVRDGVETRFGVELHPEPLLINCGL